MTRRLIIFGIILVCSSCGQRFDSDDRIYEIMDFVIQDQELRLDNGITLEPDQYTRHLLEELVIENPTDDSIELPFESGVTLRLPAVEFRGLQCLTSEELSYMLTEIPLKDFEWDNSRLKFNQENREHWYSFSMPLVSEDGNKAVVTIRDLCPGLCGHGWIVCLTKDGEKWTAQRGRDWVH